MGVDCDLGVAEAREAARPERTPGMARQQAGVVHAGVCYDLRVDTSADPRKLWRGRWRRRWLPAWVRGGGATLGA